LSDIVLDASAVMAWLRGTPGGRKVAEWLDLATQGKRHLLMSAVNWGEIFYSLWIRNGELIAREKCEEIRRLPVEFVGADLEMTQLAAELKARHGLPYADGFAAALALQRRPNWRPPMHISAKSPTA